MSLKDNLNSILTEKKHFTTQYQRKDADVRIIAVSKKHTVEKIRMAYELGQRDFGENYVQEFAKKSDVLKEYSNINWHFIGHLQSNKVKDVVGRATWIHTLDRIKLAQKIHQIAQKQKHVQKCLIQVKISEDENKTGCTPQEVQDILKKCNALDSIQIKGLMCISTLTEDQNLKKQEFLQVQELLHYINRQRLYKEPLTELSMGMSDDYPLAIACGSTMVRIGTKIFGERSK